MTLTAQKLDEASRVIAGWRRPILVTHEKPDGDALGSLSAMSALLRARGAQPDAVLFDPIPDRYDLFRASNRLVVLGRDRALTDLARCDGVIILDTCSYNQLRPIADWLRLAPQPKLAVDHHITRDDLAQHYVVDESAAATCLILFDWAIHAGWTMDMETARALFVGLATDTGWFHHSNTDARSFNAAADLVKRGARPHLLHEALYQRDSAARVRLLGVALETLELLINGQLAVMTLDGAAFAAAMATPADTEDIVNEPLRIGTVKVCVLLVDSGDGVIRVSLRSRATEGGRDVDVAAVAQSLGGGGHRNAAGVKIADSITSARTTVLQRVEPLLGR